MAISLEQRHSVALTFILSNRKQIGPLRLSKLHPYITDRALDMVKDPSLLVHAPFPTE